MQRQRGIIRSRRENRFSLELQRAVHMDRRGHRRVHVCPYGQAIVGSWGCLLVEGPDRDAEIALDPPFFLLAMTPFADAGDGGAQVTAKRANVAVAASL